MTNNGAYQPQVSLPLIGAFKLGDVSQGESETTKVKVLCRLQTLFIKRIFKNKY